MRNFVIAAVAAFALSSTAGAALAQDVSSPNWFNKHPTTMVLHRCNTGALCGGTCIAKGKTCHHPNAVGPHLPAHS